MKTHRETKSLVFRTAWQVAKSFENFSEALRYAWKAVKLRLKMLAKVVGFAYRKVDGSIRTATGTLSERHIDHGNKGRESSNKVFTYWDTERKAFRSCRIENLIF